jgi:hypothetical protein
MMLLTSLVSVTKFIALLDMNLISPQTASKLELMFEKLATHINSLTTFSLMTHSIEGSFAKLSINDTRH